MERFLEARRAPDLAVLEGFHALKHALRFGAEILEAPRHLGNLGAAIRVAAAADAAAVLTTGHNDPWHPDAIRGAAGLHFALPVGRIETAPATTERPLI